METRSNHILVGGVVLALIVAVLGFIIWLAQVSGEDNKEYDVFFKQGVDGLAKGSAVSFNGVPVGQVESINLEPRTPQFVRVRIVIREDTPILEGTTATVEGVGFTGVSQIQLDPGQAGAPPIRDEGPYGVPVIPTKPGALGQLLNTAPELLERVTTLVERLTELLSDRNQASIAGILDNLEEISAQLAERSPEITATLADARVAVQQAGQAAKEIGELADTTDRLLAEDTKPLINDLQRTVKAAEQSMTALEAVISDARPGVQAFSTQTLPEVGQLVRDLRATSEALRSITQKIDRQGAGSIIGAEQLPDYEPSQ